VFWGGGGGVCWLGKGFLGVVCFLVEGEERKNECYNDRGEGGAGACKGPRPLPRCAHVIIKHLRPPCP